MTQNTPLQSLLVTLKAQLQEIFSDKGEAPDSVVISLVDYILCRLETQTKTTILSNSLTVHEILSLLASTLSKSQSSTKSTYNAHEESPFLLFHDQTTEESTRKLNHRIRRIASFLLDNIDPTSQTNTNNPSCTAPKDVQKYMTQTITDAKEMLQLCKNRPDDMKITICEKILRLLESRHFWLTEGHDTYTQIGTPLKPHHIRVHPSCPACIEYLRTSAGRNVFTVFQECCIEMQTRVLDVITEGSVKERRRAANGRVDAFLRGVGEEGRRRRGVVEGVVRGLEGLAESVRPLSRWTHTSFRQRTLSTIPSAIRGSTATAKHRSTGIGIGLGLGLTLGLGLSLARTEPLSLDSATQTQIKSDLKLSQNEAKCVAKQEPRQSRLQLVLGFARICFRTLSLGLVFAPLFVLFPVWLVVKGDWWLDLATATCGLAGPIYIKLCQWVAMRQDLFSQEVCTAFAKLQSNSPPHAFKHTREIVEEMLNDPLNGFITANGKRLVIEDVFVEFDPIPVGVGAVAQVHRAVLKPQYVPSDIIGSKGTEARVAVKVLHPGIVPLIEMDLTLLQLGGKLVNMAMPGAKYLAIDEELETFADMMRRQLDLSIEHNNLIRFRENFGTPKKGELKLDVSFPAPIIGTPQVMMEEFCDGIRCTTILEMEGGMSGTFDEEVIKIGLPAFIRMIMKHNFIHADLHAGNMLLTFKKPSSSSSSPPEFAPPSLYKTFHSSPTSTRREILETLKSQGYIPHLIFLDVGLTATLSPKSLENIRLVASAALNGDGDKMADLFISRCRDPGLVIEKEEARARMRRMVDDVGLAAGANTVGAVLPLSKLKSAEVLRQAADFFRRHRIGLDGEWVGLFVAAVLVEGVARKLGGDVDVLEVVVDEVPDGFVV
ncbi:hypothetical protein HDU79_001184 [Rhizoclosmatium sp. JEL0117]|nr:hypothetical protein HDU79_001184 [Rhizoclosmatium sp. JEL0117]